MICFSTKFIKLVVIYIALLFIPACSNMPNDNRQNKTNQQLLVQLKEISFELKSVKLELAQVKSAVIEIHRRNIAPPAKIAAAAPTSVKNVSFGDDPILGDNKAEYAIVEFSDYECPFCKRYTNNTFNKIKKEYIDSGKLKYVFKDYPLGFHKNAKTAAIAANCAGVQKQYWLMHNKLFENQRNLGQKYYLKSAVSLGLNIEKFESCQKDLAQLTEVDNDFSYGNQVGVKGTPHFFIGKIKNNEIIDVIQISGARPFSDFSKHLQKLIGP